MLQNLTPNNYILVPYMDKKIQCEYVFLEPRGETMGGASIYAYYYKNAADFVNENYIDGSHIGFLNINLSTHGENLFDGMHDLALTFWPDFVRCGTPTI